MRGAYNRVLFSHAIITLIARHAFTPIHNKRLQNLCGPGDQNLRQMEQALDVRISYRAENFRVEGPKARTTEAMTLLQALYEQADKSLEPQLIQLMLAQEPELLAQPQALPVLQTRQGLVQPRTRNQQRYVQVIAENDITLGVGPAGTGKTFLAVACAVDALERSCVQRLVLTRPAVEAGERLGFLPGDLAQKVDPYLRPLYDALYELMGADRVHKAFERNAIEIAPLAFMRGRTLNKAFVILDEAQNTTPEQMKMFLTRAGFGSKMVINGDSSQVDLPKGQPNGLLDAQRILKSVAGVGICQFTHEDVVRHPLVARIIQAYEGDRKIARSLGV